MGILNWLKKNFVEHDYKDISEPVITLVRLVEKNPMRFSIKRNYDKRKLMAIHYLLIDKFTKEVFEFSISLKFEHRHCPLIYPSVYLTEDECEYVYERLSRVFKEKEKRFKEVLLSRKNRILKNERQRLHDIYCEEKQ